MASYEEIERLLEEASRLLDAAAHQVRDLELDPKRNVRRIAEAITLACEIRSEVYLKRPDLKPEYLKK
jgi:hypothetical protein